MNLTGTKTEKNLMEAFAGESMARNKYTYFASKAKKDGYVQISKIFEETAANEQDSHVCARGYHYIMYLSGVFREMNKKQQYFAKKSLKYFVSSERCRTFAPANEEKPSICKRFLTYFHRQEVVQEMRIEPSILNAKNRVR